MLTIIHCRTYHVKSDTDEMQYQYNTFITPGV